ncbi:hypothetical protein ACFUC1_18000 [Pedococcus sp. NPDC057267]|uniref:hypothetical protein n=1 Tax=Pedococcus sp. NPDC057267 TaxID=3346077 RepID=UPI00363E62EA
MSSPRHTPAFLATTATGLVFAVALLRGLAPFFEPDVWWHLRVGEHILDSHELYGPDPWARFADKPYMATQWLTEAVAAQVYRWTGLGGVLWLRTVAILAMALLVYAACRRLGGRLPAALASGAAVLGASASLNPRPQLVSFVLFALVLHAWLSTVQDLRPRWWLVPVFWLWACCHGLWMFGILLGVVTSLALVPRAVRMGTLRTHLTRSAALHAASVAVVALTPLGPRLLLAPFTVAGNAAGVAEEWAPTPVSNAFAITTVGAIVATAVCWLLRPSRRPMWQYAWLGLAVVLTLSMWRLVPLGAILTAPLLCSGLQGVLTGDREGVTRRERRGLVAGVVAAALVAALACVGPHGRTAFGYPEGMRAIDTALDHAAPHSVVMADFGVSGWLLYAHPELTPAADLRMEAYSPAYLARYLDAGNAKPGWQAFVDGVGARYALVERTSAIGDALAHERGWRTVATSAQFVLMAAPGVGE